ncbi:MAG: TIM barrel protein [archaeon]
MAIRFGPAGLGGVKDASGNLQEYHQLGLRACEIAFTYGVYIKSKEDAERIGEEAKKLGIRLSIHAPYWINLNSADKKIIEKSKERILKCCEVGTWLEATKVVFHPGYYALKGTKVPLRSPSFPTLKATSKHLDEVAQKKIAYKNIKNAIKEMQIIRRSNKWTPKLAPETTGKVNVFGSVDEIAQLVNDTGCSFCIDFAHILAREKDYKFKEVLKKFSKEKRLHIHFSGIEYGEKGERRHKKTPEKDLRDLISKLPKRKDVVIINESPDPVRDSLLGLKLVREK